METGDVAHTDSFPDAVPERSPVALDGSGPTPSLRRGPVVGAAHAPGAVLVAQIGSSVLEGVVPEPMLGRDLAEVEAGMFMVGVMDVGAEPVAQIAPDLDHHPLRPPRRRPSL
jgi:hypothetical protein